MKSMFEMVRVHAHEEAHSIGNLRNNEQDCQKQSPRTFVLRERIEEHV